MFICKENWYRVFQNRSICSWVATCLQLVLLFPIVPNNATIVRQLFQVPTIHTQYIHIAIYLQASCIWILWVQGDYFILCTKASCQHFSPPRRNFFHHKSYSFLSRTVRLTNSNPKALLLGCRGTLAQNRGTMGVQIPFSFPKSLDFKPLQTKVRILPWQTMSTLILSCISSFFLVYPYFS